MGKKKELRWGHTSPMVTQITLDHLNYHQKFRSDPRHLSFHGGSGCKSGTPSILPLAPSKAISTLLILWWPSYSNPCNGHLQAGLLQLTLCRPFLDSDLKTTTSTECSCSSSNKKPHGNHTYDQFFNNCTGYQWNSGSDSKFWSWHLRPYAAQAPLTWGTVFSHTPLEEPYAHLMQTCWRSPTTKTSV